MPAKAQITAEPGKQEIIITREFDAPRELVFKASTDPELVVQWWGPRSFTTKINKMEVKNGGSWRFVHTDAQGHNYGFHGVYHLAKPELTIQTFEYEGLPEEGHVILQTTKLEELPGGRTKMVVQDLFQSVADRDGMMQSGMEGGMIESHERLDELLEKMKKGGK